MKRFNLTLLTAIYLLASVGIGINRFYCCGKLASVTLTYVTADKAPKNSCDKDSCCKHEKQNLKVKDSHFIVASAALVHPTPKLLPIFKVTYKELLLMQVQERILYNGNAPPRYSDTPAYRLNCTYRI